MPSLSYWVDRVSHNTLAGLRLGGAAGAVLGRASWNQLEDVAAAVSGPIFIRLVEDEGVAPEALADVICAFILSKPAELQARLYAHGYNERHTKTAENRQAYLALELPFLRRCHSRGVKVITLNLAWGDSNPITDDLRILHDEAELSGPHHYDFYDGIQGRWLEREECSLYYRRYPAWVDRSKLFFTEAGIEVRTTPPPLWATRGWLGRLDEDTVIERMRGTVAAWARDGIAGSVWFADDTASSDWDTYHPSEKMLRAFATFPAMRGLTNGTEEPPMPGNIFDTPEFHQWVQDYTADHGLPPDQDEYHKHYTAIHTDEPVGLELVESVRTSRDAANSQLELLEPRLGN